MTDSNCNPIKLTKIAFSGKTRLDLLLSRSLLQIYSFTMDQVLVTFDIVCVINIQVKVTDCLYKSKCLQVLNKS